VQSLSQVGDVLVDGALGDTEPNGNLLGVVAGGEGAQDVDLPVGDGVVARSSGGHVGFVGKPGPSLGHRSAERRGVSPWAFGTKASAPFFMALTRSSATSHPVVAMTFTCGCARLMSARTSMPSMSGRTRSSRTPS
jgi:hypothetical protein